MKTITVGGKDYKIKYGFNSFADTDLLERVSEIATLLNANGAKDDSDVSSIGKLRDLFKITRELLFTGFERYNPVENVQEVGNILDDYRDEAPEGESRGIMDIFGMLSEELTEEGFLADLMGVAENQNNIKSIPQDHKKPAKN